MTTVHHTVALPLIAIALVLWALGGLLAKLSDATGTAAARVMGPRRQ